MRFRSTAHNWWVGLLLGILCSACLVVQLGLGTLLPSFSLAHYPPVAATTANENPQDESMVSQQAAVATNLPGISRVDCVLTTATTPLTNDTSSSLQEPTVATGVFHITVRHDLSPLASSTFVQLVQAGHFDGVFVFRVLPHFVAQFGVRHQGQAKIDMNLTRTSQQRDIVHPDTLRNARGTLSFAGGNPATHQVFVNLADNFRLDEENSRPFATVDDKDMLTIFDRLYTGYKDGTGQVKTLKQGEEAVREKFPRMSRIEHCRLVQNAMEDASIEGA